MRKNITRYPIPENFEQFVSSLIENKNNTIKNLEIHYGMSSYVVKQWLIASNIDIKNWRKIDQRPDFILDNFRQDAISGQFGQTETYRRICKDNDIIPNIKSFGYFKPDNHEEFVKYLLLNGKVKTAKKYDSNIQCLNSYIKRHNIIISSYLGLKYKLPSYDEFNENCRVLSLIDISRKYKVSSTVIQRWASELKIELNIDNFFEKCKKTYNLVVDNKEKYIELNKTLDLLEISKRECISYEQLKKLFREYNLPIRIHSYNKSRGELEVKKFVNELGFDSISVKPFYNNIRYEMDIYVKDKNLAIEYCGEYYHSSLQKDKKYHSDKRIWCKEQGIKLLTIFENEWYHKNDIIKSMIKSRLGFSEKIMARKTKFEKIDNDVAKSFHGKYHINGGINSSQNFALIHNDEIVSVLSLSKSRFDKKYEYEIIRYSTKLNTTVVGGFSKLIKNVILELNSSSIVTYADLRFGNGDVYQTCGFNFIGTTVPNYWYIHKNRLEDGFINRMAFQKKKLIAMGWGSEDQTETEIMVSKNYFKIYDCGNNKFGLIPKS
jgi:hypothetical protein